MFLVALVLCAPSYAQSADAPVAVLDSTQLDQCPPGSVVLKPEVAIETAKRLASAEAKVAVYDAHPPVKWYVVVLIGALAAGAGVAITAGIYEAGKRP